MSDLNTTASQVKFMLCIVLLLVLSVLSDGPEEIRIAFFSVICRNGPLGRVGDHHGPEVLRDAGNGLNRVGARRSWN